MSRRGAFNRTVLALGMTSFFMDISSEMVTAVVPLFLTVTLGFTPAAFGIYQAGYELANAALRIVGGTIADRTGRPKETATAGYAVSTVTRAGLVASALVAIPAVPFLLIDRLGKGLRTGPRDAMISLATPRKAWGAAFGVHRTMDAAGALLGPLLAFVVLMALPNSFDSVFVISLCFALISVAVIGTFVRNPTTQRRPMGQKVRTSIVAHWGSRGFRRISVLAGALGLFSIGDGFVYLVIWDHARDGQTIGVGGFGSQYFPLLFVGTAVAYLVTATPLGKLADRIGRGRMWVAGHVVLAGVYAVLLTHPSSTLGVIGVLVLLGLHYGATDGMLPALASGVIAPEVRSSGLSLLTTIVASSRAVSALLFGLIWGWMGADRALVIAASGLCAVALAAAIHAISSPDQSEFDV
ncbi:MAG: MFS transporter [Acidimicrobiales bacterium]|nr:MFS transporter [Acidimicrobiales bacterium]RZV41551.1 MAG: MFS transporter [Acidimicrobiales bacterium]